MLQDTEFASFIVPEVWLRLETNDNLRKFLLSNTNILSLWLTGKVFDDAVVYTCIPVFENRIPDQGTLTTVVLSEEVNTIGVEPKYQSRQMKWLLNRFYRIEYLISPTLETILEKIDNRSTLFNKAFEVAQGLTAYDKYRGHDEQTIKNRIYHARTKKDDTYKIWIDGEDVARYELGWSGEWISYGEWLGAPRDPKIFIGQRLLLREVPGSGRRIQVTLTSDELYYGHSIIPCLPNANLKLNLYSVLGLTNSKLISFYGRIRLPNFAKAVFPKLNPTDVNVLPICHIAFYTSEKKRKTLVQQAEKLILLGDTVGLLDFIDLRLAVKPEESDVIHDLLATLAEQMIELNKQKQGEMKRFIGWLEGVLKVSVDELTGKSKLRNYIGDYQKGEFELSYAELEDMLYKNRNKIGISTNDARPMAKIRDEYEKSLAILRPLKSQLAWTDSLIDQIVYRLYGLTEEEIRVVEGK